MMSQFEKFKILDTLFEAAVVVKSSGELLYYNHHFTTLSRLSPRQLKKIQKLEEVTKSYSDQIAPLILACQDTKTPQLSPEINIELGNSQSPSTVVLKVSMLDDSSFLILLNDISIEKRLYDKYKIQLKELEQTHNQIIQADKLATIGEMTANISHEISNPLTIASGNLEVIEAILETEELSNEDLALVKTSLNDISEAHQRINTIMSNMKTFLHQSESHREYCDLGELIKRTLQFIAPKIADYEVDVKIHQSTPNPIVLIDPPKLEQVFINIIKNAIDSMAKKDKNKNLLKINISKEGHNSVKISFEDNGLGIKPESQDKIFEAFYTTKAIGEGTGLGLAISQKIVQSHRGVLKLTHSSPESTTFTISLPSIEIVSYTQNEILHGRKSDNDLVRILVVDDEVKILNIMNRLITDEDMVFIGSASPMDALEMLQELPLDLIILDYYMPKMNGDVFAQKVRESNRTIPILYMSSSDNHDKYLKDQKDLALSGMIEKPFKKEEMIQAIKNAIKSKDV